MKTHSQLAQFWQTLEQRPYDYDFYALLRRIENNYDLVRPLGRNALPRHEPVRLGQLPSLAFAPAPLQAITHTQQKPQVHLASFGLFGPNGALPLHLTEHAHERLHQHRDPSFTAFANLFHHRLISLFYRAWADNQSAVSLDTPVESFSRYVGSLSQQDPAQPPSNTDPLVAPHSQLYFAGFLADSRRCASGLEQLLCDFFNVPVRIVHHIPQWITLSSGQQWRLGQLQPLGKGVILGKKIYDAQYKFRLQLGPLRLDQFTYFLPKQRGALQLQYWVQRYLGIELEWDTQLILEKKEVQGVRLGTAHSLGLSSWLGHRPNRLSDADDVIISYTTPD